MSLEDYFPALAATGYRLTSPTTAAYNCFAWAAGQTDAWWEPDPDGNGYWPVGAARQRTPEAVSAAFATLGYQRCPDGSAEPSTEKVAIYAVGDRPTHAARQLAGGRWTSKLGALEDIEHELAGLVGPTYGDVVLFLRRQVSP